MKKSIADYLHFYLGCDAEIQESGFKYLSFGHTNRAILTGIFHNEVYLKVDNDDGFDLGTDDVKPILRPLSSMTEDERAEIWQMIFKRPFKGGTIFIFRRKKPAIENIGIEISKKIFDQWNVKDGVLHGWQLLSNFKGWEKSPSYFTFKHEGCNFTIIQNNAIEYLSSIKAKNPFGTDPKRILIYLDPPYLNSTRLSNTKYQHELFDNQHEELLKIITKLPYLVMISGYDNELYKRYLKKWHRVEYKTIDRGNNIRTEVLWMNYPPPVELHDYTHLGADHRKREDLRQKIKRYVAKFQSMPQLERKAILMHLNELAGIERQEFTQQQLTIADNGSSTVAAVTAELPTEAAEEILVDPNGESTDTHRHATAELPTMHNPDSTAEPPLGTMVPNGESAVVISENPSSDGIAAVEVPQEELTSQCFRCDIRFPNPQEMMKFLCPQCQEDENNITNENATKENIKAAILSYASRGVVYWWVKERETVLSYANGADMWRWKYFKFISFNDEFVTGTNMDNCDVQTTVWALKNCFEPLEVSNALYHSIAVPKQMLERKLLIDGCYLMTITTVKSLRLVL